MSTLPAGIAAEAAQLRANVALSSIKKNAEAGQDIANLLQQSVDNVPTSSVRGTNVNRTA